MAMRNFCWIMVYQDHLTKLCILRPLTSKRAAEVAYQLIDIFFTDPFQILQSDNGSEFSAAVTVELKSMREDLHLVPGKPRHQSANECSKRKTM